MGLSTAIERSLREHPWLFSFAKKAYMGLKRLGRAFSKAYIRVLELFTPPSFYLQNFPRKLQEVHSSSFRKEEREFSRKSRRPVKDGVRLISAKLLLDQVYDLKEGEYAELGTYRGKFARVIFDHKHPEATLYCFDTFEGFSEEDVTIENSKTERKRRSGHFSDTSIEIVKRNIVGKNSEKENLLKLIKGRFPDTFKGFENKKWRFVHLDADLYEPMKEGIKAFWPHIVEGGVLLIHDYNGGYVGVKQAVEEYFSPLGIVPIPLPDKVGSAVIIKDFNRNG